MAAKLATSDETISDINIVPLVDIILVVLIIFMVTAPAMIKPSIKVNLPEASSGDSTEPSFLQIAINSEGLILINNQEVNEDLAREIARSELKKNPKVQAVISADTNSRYGLIIQVMDWMKSEGVEDFAVSTDRSLTSNEAGL